MNYSVIKNCDIANGPGARVSLFVSGCTHHCPGCFQPETWDFSYGKPFTKEVEELIFSMLEPWYIEGLTLLGGEPFEPENQIELLLFVNKVNERFPKKTIWAYSGFTLEELLRRSRADGIITLSLLNKIDILVDGPFVAPKKDLRLKFCGSSNQRLIDLRRTINTGVLTLWHDPNGD